MKKTKSQSKSKVKPQAKSNVKPQAKTAVKAKSVAKSGTKSGTKSLATKKSPPKAQAPKSTKSVKGSVKKTGRAKVPSALHPKPGAKNPVLKPKAAPKPAPKASTKPAIVKKEKPLKTKATEKASNKKSVVNEVINNDGLLDAKVPPILEEPDQAEELILTDAEGRQYCRVKDCDRLAEVEAYCRYHYILLWKNIQTRRHILQEGKLERYIEELTARYPDKFLEILKKDLRTDKDFMAAIQELEIDESAVEAEFDDEESQSDIFEIQRVSDSGGGARSGSDDGDRF